uniref:Uncharacterized protein n=1 Tax=Arundo donax TaxID=35708 RepID=A0A0A8Z8Y3_ARUDO
MYVLCLLNLHNCLLLLCEDFW